MERRATTTKTCCPPVRRCWRSVAYWGKPTPGIDFGRVRYISDAGWTWRRFPLRADAQAYRLAHGARGLRAVTLEAIIEEVRTPGRHLYLNTHPELWFETSLAAGYHRLRRRVGRRVLSSAVRQRIVARLKGRQGL